MAGKRGHAIVLGGSMAGLGAARALANHFDRITLVERDDLTTGSANRYMARAHRIANKDPVVLRRFFEVASLLAPSPAMMAPGIAWRVFTGDGSARETSPARKVTAAQS